MHGASGLLRLWVGGGERECCPEFHLEGWGGSFQSRMGVGLALIPEEEVAQATAGRVETEWSAQERQIIDHWPDDPWPEIEGKRMKDEAVQVSRATCSGRLWSAWVTWLVFSVRNVLLEDDMEVEKAVKKLLYYSTQEIVGSLKQGGGGSGKRETWNNLRVIWKVELTDLSNLLAMRNVGKGRIKGESRLMAWLTGCTQKCEPMREV